MVTYYKSRKDMVEAIVPEGTCGAKLGTTCVDFNHILLARNPSVLHLADDWGEGPIWHSETFDAVIHLRCDEAQREFEKYPNVRIHRKRPEAFIDEYGGELLDWIYLDLSLNVRGGMGCRHGREIETDVMVRKCCERLKPGGILMGSHGNHYRSRQCLKIYFERTGNNYIALTHEESNHNMSWAFRKGEKPKLKIKVLQAVVGDVPSYALSEKINRHYCKRHGYEYVILKEEPPREYVHNRHPMWLKIPAIQQELRDCDYLLYLDGDAFFYGQEFGIEPLVHDTCPFSVVRCSNNVADEYWRHWGDQCQDGVLLFCNTPRAHFFLREWNKCSDAHPEWRYDNGLDQTALCHLAGEYPHWVFKEENYYLMNGMHGFFIRHLNGCDEIERYDKMTAYIEGRGIE